MPRSRPLSLVTRRRRRRRETSSSAPAFTLNQAMWRAERALRDLQQSMRDLRASLALPRDRRHLPPDLRGAVGIVLDQLARKHRAIVAVFCVSGWY